MAKKNQNIALHNTLFHIFLFQVSVSSLRTNAPITLNNTIVTEKASSITNMDVMSIGTCSFRFVYNKNVSTSPLVEANNVATPSKV